MGEEEKRGFKLIRVEGLWYSKRKKRSAAKSHGLISTGVRGLGAEWVSAE